MELVESVEFINAQIRREFGLWPDGSPNWRVVLAGEQTEKRVVDCTEEGFELLTPEVREVRKYQYIDPYKYVLERQVPVTGQTDLITKTSYEPAWTFEDRFGNYLPPRYDACKFIIEGIYGQKDKSEVHKKYKDPMADPDYKEKLIKDIEFKLFGNETPVTDALRYGTGVTDFNQKVKINDKE